MGIVQKKFFNVGDGTMLIWLLYIILYGILGLLVLFLGLVAIFAIFGGRQEEKIGFGLPFNRWLTLDECAHMGYSRFWCRFVIAQLHEDGCVEARLLGGAPEQKREYIEGCGFTPFTIAYFEFRIIRRPRRQIRIGWRDLMRLSKWLPALFPAPADHKPCGSFYAPASVF